MTIKNISQKVINIGTTILMPDKEMKATKEIAGAPSIKAMAEHGLLAIIGDNAGKNEERTATSTDNDGNKTDTGDTGEKSDTETGGKKPLSRMNKTELLEECTKLGIEASEDDDNKTLVEKIKAANVG